MMRFMQWLHRWVSLILIIQVLLWIISAAVFSLMGHHGMSGHQYMRHVHPPILEKTAPVWPLENVRKSYPDADSIVLRSVLGQPQYQIKQEDNWVYLNARDGHIWQTDTELATRLAEASYNGPGEVTDVTAITSTDEVIDWQGNGFRVDFADDLNTRVYVDADSGQIIEHRNTLWVIADWAFRLHFMDYSGERSFNHLLIWSAGLFALWFSLSGLILLLRNIAQGDFNPRRKPTWLEQLQRDQQPIASSCGGGGTCGLCKVTFTGDQIPAITPAERSMLSAAEVQGGLRLACQHRVRPQDEVELANADVATHQLTLVNKRDLTPSLTELTFTAERAIDYAAGQFMQFKIPHKEAALTRHYSMATKPGSNQLVFTVRHMPAPTADLPPGVGSTFLCQLQPGDQVEAIGPFGDFVLSSQPQRKQVFIGGGAGIAPLRALIQAELDASQPRDCVFFYGARNSNELCYTGEFSVAEAVDYTPVLSEPAAGDNWTGPVGFVHTVAEQWLATQDVQTLDVYVCGPPPMLKATMAMLAKAGVPRDNIRFDDFGI
ncbi:FAD-binding oxidoreductase [Pseudidiomarina insulisalsae]|uniref:NADH:quinone oxidoreductase n=1 Tax=Pseudidiomarina insulisalsae TaxID=575789 RepID=A0A432YQF9_9GAMM|nr:FAD-binding oxidoreductase [Pseudidiomarina insulisalsae]RUO63562.1 NADH:quinone oxidoreductase [Pseudidiomarina insulisalsae]